MDYGYVIKKDDNWYIVDVDLNNYYSGYGVVPKTEDPWGKYDIEDVKVYCEANPDKVLTEHPLAERVFLQEERNFLDQWLHDHDYIGTKIATGRATPEEYEAEIAEMTAKAERINEIDAILNGSTAS